MKKHLVVLCDYGLDDAVATAHLLENRQMFDGIDIVAIAGNCSAETSFRNAKTLLSNFGEEHDVILVDTTSIKQKFAVLPSIHGNDSMGDLLSLKALNVPILQYDEWIDTLDKFLLISLGPCALTLDILKKCGAQELLIMAGMVSAEPNFNGYEFNQALDVKSYNECLKYPHKIATLDTCRHHFFNLVGKDIAGDSLKHRLMLRARELAEARHPDNCYVYDYITVLSLTEDIFKCEKVTDKWGNKLNQLVYKY